MSDTPDQSVPSEILFVVTEADKGGYVAQAIGTGIVTEVDELTGLRSMVRDAVACHYPSPRPDPRPFASTSSAMRSSPHESAPAPGRLRQAPIEKLS